MDFQGENEQVGAGRIPQGRAGPWQALAYGLLISQLLLLSQVFVRRFPPARNPSSQEPHVLPKLQINAKLNTLALGTAPRLSSLTSLALLNCGLHAGNSLLQHFDALPSLRRLEAMFEGFCYMPMHLGGTDKAGRAVAARLLAGRRWELVRELAAAEE